MKYSITALQTYSTYELTTLAEQFSAAMQMAPKGSTVFQSAAQANYNVTVALRTRRLGH